jgi:hypothetical protein
LARGPDITLPAPREDMGLGLMGRGGLGPLGTGPQLEHPPLLSQQMQVGEDLAS